MGTDEFGSRPSLLVNVRVRVRSRDPLAYSKCCEVADP
jgi:hypothetical protein